MRAQKAVPNKPCLFSAEVLFLLWNETLSRERWAWWVFTTDIWEQQNGVRIDVQPQWNIFPVVRTPLIPQKRENVEIEMSEQ